MKFRPALWPKIGGFLKSPKTQCWSFFHDPIKIISRCACNKMSRRALPPTGRSLRTSRPSTTENPSRFCSLRRERCAEAGGTAGRTPSSPPTTSLGLTIAKERRRRKGSGSRSGRGRCRRSPRRERARATAATSIRHRRWQRCIEWATAAPSGEAPATGMRTLPAIISRRCSRRSSRRAKRRRRPGISRVLLRLRR